MHRSILTYILATVGIAGLAHEVDTLSVLDRQGQRERLDDGLIVLAWQNLAARQWQHATSLTTVGAGGDLRHQSQAVVTQLGHHAAQWTVDAGTEVKHSTSTLWGTAHYDNGSTRGIAWNETSDLDIVGPYVMADSAGLAPLKHEHYAFGGAYADHRGRLHWGGELAYRAGHYYRSQDPRPRNVTAALDVRAGVGWGIGTGMIAHAAVEYEKYKQTNSVTFYSELGKEKIFHLTGLTNDYGRFAGAADEAVYRGHSWSGTLGLHAPGGGPSATVVARRRTVEKVLTPLNKLPLARLTHTALLAEAAWRAAAWSAIAHVAAERRVGTERIFGDPAASVYPQIAELDLYHDNRLAAGAAAAWHCQTRTLSLDAMPAIDYAHHNAVYADPACRWLTNSLTTALTLRGGWRAHSTLTTLTLGTAWCHPTSSELRLTGVKSELDGLRRGIESDFGYASHNSLTTTVAASATRAINAQLALQIAVQWQYAHYTASTHGHNLQTTVAVVF